MCERQEIRYVHVMVHPEHPAELRCGCVCAGAMSGDLAQARSREAALKSVAQRRAAWSRRAWRVSGRGNRWLNARGYHVVVFPKGHGYGCKVTAPDGKWLACELPLPTLRAAMAASFEGLERLRGIGPA
jgi:hypothetical protein